MSSVSIWSEFTVNSSPLPAVSLRNIAAVPPLRAVVLPIVRPRPASRGLPPAHPATAPTATAPTPTPPAATQRRRGPSPASTIQGAGPAAPPTAAVADRRQRRACPTRPTAPGAGPGL